MSSPRVHSRSKWWSTLTSATDGAATASSTPVKEHNAEWKDSTMPTIKDLEPLIGRWRQVVDAPRHVEERSRAT
jgi:hypothetical protein